MEPFWGGLGEGFVSFWADFRWILVVLKGSNFEVEVEDRISGSKSTKGCSRGRREMGPAALKRVLSSGSCQ